MLYLDHNATTPLDPRVLEAMRAAWEAGYANPASQHREGQRARARLEEIRERLAALLGADTGRRGDRLLFTSGGTEANNLALQGLALRGARRLIVSAIEHPSVSETAAALAQRGARVERLGVDRHGVVRLEELRRLLEQPASLVAVMFGNHETGALQPVEEIGAVCREAGVPWHCDAVQGVGKGAVDFTALGAATLAFTAHKLHGPRGVGGLLVRHGAPLAPLLFGGPQQEELRPGTEDVALPAGLLRAVELAEEEGAERRARMQLLRDRFEAVLCAADPRIAVIAAASPRLPHTSCLAFRGLDRQQLLLAFDFAGVACSTGSACASGSSEPSPVLRAMGLPEEEVRGALRFSLGAGTTAAEIEEAIQRILAVLARMP